MHVYLVYFAFQGSRDNMSLVLITLPGAPKVSEEAKKKEQELEDLIEKKVTGKTA